MILLKIRISKLCFLAFFIVVSCSQEIGYVEQLNLERSSRDDTFRDPLSSALATVGIILLEKEVSIFGSRQDADLKWTDPSIRPQHARIQKVGGNVLIEALEGDVLTQDGKSIVQSEWKVGDKFQAGSVYLVLQLHPVGPVVRIIDPNSPELEAFTGLEYFPVDPDYRVKGNIEVGDMKKTQIIDTQGWKRDGWVYGKFKFSIDGIALDLNLLVFQEIPDKNSPFMLIFKDETSGKTTYPACRYLFIPFQKDGEIWVDFNRAVNPSCAYGKGFACPLPPPGNHLKVAIEAGEKYVH